MISILFSAGLVPFVILFGSLVASIAVHEFAHAFAADKLGDPTPRSQGRLTLDPRAHLDPLGTLAILFTWFGWGRPVQFDPFNLENPRKDAAIISSAGPISSLAFALLVALIMRVLPSSPLILITAISIVRLNVILAIFNLIPIHPLDGGKILIGLLPRNLAYEWNAVLSQYGMIILLFLIFPFTGTSPISYFISPIVSGILNILLP